MRRFAFVLLASFALTACTVSYQPGTSSDLPKSTAGTVPQRTEAVNAAREYLALIDRKHFDATWERAGPALKASTNEFMWSNTLKLAHGMLGDTSARKVEGVGFSTRVDASVPVGEYALVQFTSPSGGMTATEKVVMQKADGAWKIIGYFIVKRAQFNSST